MVRLLIILYFASASMMSIAGQQSTPQWMKESPTLGQPNAAFEIPLTVIATKLYVEVELGGVSRRFVFDTGSPSMIDKQLVQELGLTVIDTNRGTDAHGTVVETDIVQADIKIGGVDIRKVPMMAADFSKSIVTKAFVGDGVIGSDLLPLGAWQIDLQNSVLRFNTELKRLPHVRGAKKMKLHQYGYPYMPIFDISFAKRAQSKAMLDTGSPTLFSISDRDFDGAQKAGGLGQVISGFGTPGSSLGGQAPNTQLTLVKLEKLAIDKLKLGQVVADKRNLSPSLIGARILEHYIVTFQAREEKAYFKQFLKGNYSNPTFGFTLAFGQDITIGSVWENSPAYAAGMTVGKKVTSINGVAVEMTEPGLQHALNAMGKTAIEVTWEGGSARLEKVSLISME